MTEGVSKVADKFFNLIGFKNGSCPDEYNDLEYKNGPHLPTKIKSIETIPLHVSSVSRCLLHMPALSHLLIWTAGYPIFGF